MRFAWLATISFFLLLACGDDDDALDTGSDVGRDAVGDVATDADADASTPVECDPPAAFEGGAAPEPVALGDGLVAGRLSAAQLPTDVLGLGEWREGDFVLANEEVGAIISQADHPGQTYDPYGGRLVGVAGVGSDALVDAGPFGFNVLSAGRFLVATRSVTVLSDGSEGTDAVIRVEGPLAALTALGEVVETLSSTDFTGAEGALDYRLAPGSNAIDVTLSVRPLRRVVRPERSLQVFFQANRMPAWRPSSGFGEAAGSTPLVAFTDDRATSYAWAAPEGETLSYLLSTGGADVFSSERTRFECGENVLLLGRIVIGADGGMPSLMQSHEGTGGDATTTLSGRVVDTAGDAVTDVRVHAVGPDDAHFSRFVVDDTGAFSVPVDTRATQLFVWRAGFPLAGPFPIAEENVLEVPVASTLRIHATEGLTGDAMPVKVEVFRTDGETPSAPEAFGEASPGGGRVHFENPIDGTLTLEVPAGEYRVRVGRGPTYERFEQVVTLDGDEIVLDVVLDEVFPNPGVLCGDFHLHSHGSVDSPDRADDKLRSIAANGVQIAIRTEHEYIREYQPLIDDLGLGAHVRGFTGLELSTVAYGHFNTFPLRITDGPGNGAPLWPGKLPTELFDSVRDRPEAPTLIINHPRSGTLQGYFDAAEYDPVTGAVGRLELWDEEFQVVEVFNDSDFEGNRDASVADWFSLLNQGRRIAATGSSDSHRITSAPPGYPRTCLALGTDDPREVTGPQLQAAIEGGASVVYGGIDVRVTGPGDTAPGDTVMGAGSVAMFNVRLIAADYVDLNRLEVIVDGVTAQTIAIDSPGAGVRYDEDIPIDVAPEGSWVVFHAAGDAPFDANGSRPFGVSNPVFLER